MEYKNKFRELEDKSRLTPRSPDGDRSLLRAPATVSWYHTQLLKLWAVMDSTQLQSHAIKIGHRIFIKSFLGLVHSPRWRFHFPFRFFNNWIFTEIEILWALILSSAAVAFVQSIAKIACKVEQPFNLWAYLSIYSIQESHWATERVSDCFWLFCHPRIAAIMVPSPRAVA
jgi:hypothetical protein